MKTTSTLYEKTNYTSSTIDFLINSYIREYDIRRAGPTALLIAGCIDEQTYSYICSLPRDLRQVQTGLLQKDPEVADTLKSTMSEARRLFIESNGLNDSDILSIKNDAIYVVGKTPAITTFYDGRLMFVVKNQYTSYYRYNRTEMYYYGDMRAEAENLDIKNIGDNRLERHRDYFIDFLLYLFGMAQVSPVHEVIGAVQAMITQYINLQLPLGYYREFNARSDFKIISGSPYTNFYAGSLPETTDLRSIDISQNLDILRYFYKLFSDMYFRQK